MYRLVYASIATRLLSGVELLALLNQARRNNEKAQVTGMLLYKAGNFLQVLEGEEKFVRMLAAKISRDARHEKMITLAEGAIAEREFADWAMGFANLDVPTAAEAPGYSEFMNTPLTADEFRQSPGRAQRLLRIFKSS